MDRDIREVKLIHDNHGNHVEFNSNGRRKKRFITITERKKLEELIANKDYAGIDLFCYNIA